MIAQVTRTAIVVMLLTSFSIILATHLARMVLSSKLQPIAQPVIVNASYALIRQITVHHVRQMVLIDPIY